MPFRPFRAFRDSIRPHPRWQAPHDLGLDQSGAVVVEARETEFLEETRFLCALESQPRATSVVLGFWLMGANFSVTIKPKHRQMSKWQKGGADDEED